MVQTARCSHKPWVQLAVPPDVLSLAEHPARHSCSRAQLPPWLAVVTSRPAVGSSAWTLPLSPSALPEFFLERLFSKNSLKICNYHTRA